MPLDNYWTLEKLLNELAYLQASQENPAETTILINRIYKLCTPYTVSERNRIWMQDKLNEEPTT